MKARDHITVEYLRSSVTYNPDTGEMRWIYRPDMSNSWNARFPGKEVGTTNAEDHRFFRIKGRRITAHRAAWAIMTGEWPTQEVDHRDTIRSHNWWSNLREATPMQNRQNKGKNSNNTSGYKGVTFCKLTGRWSVSIGHNNKHQYLGRYDTPEEGHAVYCAAAKVLHGDFANMGET